MATSVFKKYFIDVLVNKYADFGGRARRAEYWYFTLFNALVGFVIGLVAGLLGLEWLSYIWTIGVFVPAIALAVRRLHDIGKNGWWYLIILIPLIGAIWLLILFCKEGDSAANAYGENPKA